MDSIKTLEALRAAFADKAKGFEAQDREALKVAVALLNAMDEVIGKAERGE